jgi:hypothetical protein
LEKTVGQGFFCRNSKTVELFRFLYFALKAGVMTQLSSIDFMHPSMLVDLHCGVTENV